VSINGAPVTCHRLPAAVALLMIAPLLWPWASAAGAAPVQVVRSVAPPRDAGVDAAWTRIPPVDWSDLHTFKRAMKRGAEDTVARFADANHYVIVASLTIGTDATIAGAERVRFTNRTDGPLSEIVFRLYPNTAVLKSQMEVANVCVDGRPVQPAFSQLDSVMALVLAAPLEARSSVEIAMDFTVTMTGGVSVSYGRFGYEHGVVSGTAWYPTLSVYDEGRGWWEAVPSPEGDPAYTETGLYDVSLTAPADEAIAMSGTEIATVRNRDGTVTHRDVTGPMRDHAFLASARYAVVSGGADGVRVNVWHYKDAPDPQTDATADVLGFARAAIRAYDRAYGRYPFQEFDVVENPTPTGVEYPGLVEIAEDEWTQGNSVLERTVAHETGHQWFYSLVGNDQVNHPWLDEGLTSYTEFVYLRAVHPADAGAAEEASRRGYEAYVRNGGPDLPLDLPVGRYSAWEYGQIVYAKTAVFLLHLEEELGRDVVVQALATYFQRYEYQVAKPDDLERVIEEVSGRHLAGEFRTWVGH
jgi:aminopeptidase N